MQKAKTKKLIFFVLLEKEEVGQGQGVRDVTAFLILSS